MNNSTGTQNGPKPTHSRQEVSLFLRVKPRKQNPEIAQNGYVKSRCAFFIPADDSALSATAQTQDYRVTPLIYSRSILSATGTTGSVVRMRFSASAPTVPCGRWNWRYLVNAITLPSPYQFGRLRTEQAPGHGGAEAVGQRAVTDARRRQR